VVAAILGLKPKWMFFDQIVSDPNNQKQFSKEADLIEEKNTGVLEAKGLGKGATIARVNVMDQDESYASDHSTKSR
jgi:hypothetical protein